ncbi:MAG: hypothetical protein ACC618_04045 [Patescibacteria group bacterium]
MEKEGVPKENETIAARRAARLAEKLKKTKGFAVGRAWWSNTTVEIGAFLLVFLLNVYLVIPFFGTSSPDTFFSGPIIPLLARAVGLFGSPLSYAIQIVNIFFFLLFPLSYYLFIRSVSDRKLIALFAVLFASLPFYPFGQTRVSASLLGPDTAHIASLAVLPIALYGLLSFNRSGGIGNLLIASLASAGIALISPFGFMTYLIFASISTFSEMLLGNGRLKLTRFLLILVFAGGLNAFWYNPGFFLWMITGPLGGEIRSMVSKLIPILFFTLPVLGAFGYLLFDRKPSLQPVFLASFYSISFSLIALAGGGIFPSHPSRYASELGISLSFLISITVMKGVDFLRFTKSAPLARLNSKLAANLSLIIIFLLLVTSMVIGKNRLLAEGGQVLGIWEGVERGKIWEAKDRFKGVSSVAGYAITAGSVVGLSVMSSKMRKRI